MSSFFFCFPDIFRIAEGCCLHIYLSELQAEKAEAMTEKSAYLSEL